MESELVDSLDELIAGHARGIERHPRLLVAEAHVRSLHPWEPSQSWGLKVAFKSLTGTRECRDSGMKRDF